MEGPEGHFDCRVVPSGSDRNLRRIQLSGPLPGSRSFPQRPRDVVHPQYRLVESWEG